MAAGETVEFSGKFQSGATTAAIKDDECLYGLGRGGGRDAI